MSDNRSKHPFYDALLSVDSDEGSLKKIKMYCNAGLDTLIDELAKKTKAGKAGCERDVFFIAALAALIGETDVIERLKPAILDVEAMYMRMSIGIDQLFSLIRKAAMDDAIDKLEQEANKDSDNKEGE